MPRILEDAATPGDATEAARRSAARLATGFTALVAATAALIVLGALVRAHGAGLACPDWPLCFGELIPTMNLGVAFEWTHRVVAGCVGVCFAGLAVASLRRPDTRRVTVPLLTLAALLLAAQVVLGALTVWKRLAAWSVTAHLLTGNAFAISLLWTACALRDLASPPPPRPRPGRRARRALALAALLLGAQFVLGGLVSSRYAGLACPEWPTCNGGVWFPGWRGPVGLHLLHRWNGYALLLALAAAAAAGWREPGLRAAAAGALSLGLLQVTVGIANVLLGLPVEVTGLHSALAATLALTLALAARSAWPPAVARAP